MIRISEELIVEIAPGGKLDGIELLNANEQLAFDKKRNWYSLTKWQGKGRAANLNGKMT